MKAIIIDDEPMPAKHLKNLLQSHCFEIDSIQIENSPIEAVKILKREVFDVIFLDVEMPEMTGFDILNEVNLSQRSSVIFTTAYSQYALKAFEANAVHYLLKMVTKDDLITAVRKVMRSKVNELGSSSQKKFIPIYHNEEYLLLEEKDIIRLEASKSYTYFVTKDNKILSSKGIGFYEKKLNPRVFFRCHNSHLINIKKLEKIGKGRGSYVTLSNDDIVPLSESKKEELENKLGL